MANPRPRSASILYPPMFTGGLPIHLKAQVTQEQYVTSDSGDESAEEIMSSMLSPCKTADRSFRNLEECREKVANEEQSRGPSPSRVTVAKDEKQTLQAVRSRGFLPHPRVREALFQERRRCRDLKEAAEYMGVDGEMK